ncbi:MAG: hypothetical protein CL742_01265 [Chloroflexi bacterium]|nr:hypothetical protein [Chloroflexota bacterium]
MVASKWVGISTIIIGVLLVSVSLVLFIMGISSAEKMESLNVESTTPLNSPTVTIQSTFLPPNPTPIPPKIINISEPVTPENITNRLSPDLQSNRRPHTEQKLISQAETTQIAKPVGKRLGSFNTLIQGYGSENFSKYFHPADWGISRWHKIDHLRGVNVDESLLSPIGIDQLTAPDFSGLATRIRIPALDVDAPVNQLRIIEIEGVKQYESPKNVVGRVPTDSNLLESITGWYFGHLESPVKSEGNVFHNLPEIASFLSDGDPVHIYLNNREKEYIYQAYKSEVVHETELKLYDAGLENIVLVTCVNRPYYDHRQVVTARLVDIR